MMNKVTINGYSQEARDDVIVGTTLFADHYRMTHTITTAEELAGVKRQIKEGPLPVTNAPTYTSKAV